MNFTDVKTNYLVIGQRTKWSRGPFKDLSNAMIAANTMRHENQEAVDIVAVQTTEKREVVQTLVPIKSAITPLENRIYWVIGTKGSQPTVALWFAQKWWFAGSAQPSEAVETIISEIVMPLNNGPLDNAPS